MNTYHTTAKVQFTITFLPVQWTLQKNRHIIHSLSNPCHHVTLFQCPAHIVNNSGVEQLPLTASHPPLGCRAFIACINLRYALTTIRSILIPLQAYGITSITTMYRYLHICTSEIIYVAKTNIKQKRTQTTHTETRNGKILGWWIIILLQTSRLYSSKKLLPVVDFGRSWTTVLLAKLCLDLCGGYNCDTTSIRRRSITVRRSSTVRLRFDIERQANRMEPGVEPCVESKSNPGSKHRITIHWTVVRDRWGDKGKS